MVHDLKLENVCFSDTLLFDQKRLLWTRYTYQEQGTPIKYPNRLSGFKNERERAGLVGDELQMAAIKWRARALICIKFKVDVYRFKTTS